MNSSHSSDLQGLWAVTWRAFVYLPLMLGMFVILLVHGMGLLMLPILAAACLWYGFWLWGLAMAAGWLLLFWSWRHFRLL